MATVMWGWAGVWLVMRLWLDWKVGTQWLPGTDEIREEWTRGSVAPPNALTAEGERLWVTLHRVTVWGFLGWVGIAVLWFVS